MATGDQWDFYACRIDDAPASIFLNLRYEETAPPETATTLYRIRIAMQDPDEHGMGSAAEASAMNEHEDEIDKRAEEGGLLYVGRIRSRAEWELVFYGPPALAAVLQSVREVFGERRTYADVRPDPTWGFYREFLLPDEERRIWMTDRSVVQVLADRGDRLATPRRVDHWAHFATAQARDRFVRAAQQLGFTLERAAQVDTRELAFGAQVYRADAVDLDHIHDVVMELHELVARDDGDYDGWDCAVIPE